MKDPAARAKLEGYVKGVVGRFKDDKRMHMWDVYNEPDNANDSSYGKDNLKVELDKDKKVELSPVALKEAFALGAGGRPVASR